MKKVLLSMVIICIATLIKCNMAYGQTELQSATLQQGDKTSIYYGQNAFSEAFDAVTDSADVITLSSGFFNSPTINKAVTIYGAGYESNEIKGVYPTMLNGFYILHGKEINGTNKIGDLNGIHIEGVRVEGDVFIGDGREEGNPVVLSNLEFKRCFFSRISFETYVYTGGGIYVYGNATTTNTHITNCVIATLYVDTNAGNFTIFNSIINDIEGLGQENELLVKNCLIFSGWDTVGTFKDNILLVDRNGGLYHSGEPYGIFFNNIFKSSEVANNIPFTNKTNNWTNISDKNIFGESVGAFYNPQISYKLENGNESIYIGTDGTQVGLYGGFYPFTKTPSTPQIISKEIEAKSTEDGKLKVSIKVEAQE